MSSSRIEASSVKRFGDMGIELFSFLATCLSHTHDTNTVYALGPHNYRSDTAGNRANRDKPMFRVAEILLAGCSEGMAGKRSATISKSDTVLMKI